MGPEGIASREIAPDTELMELVGMSRFSELRRPYKGRDIAIGAYFDQPDVTPGLPALRDEFKFLAGKPERSTEEEERFQLLGTMITSGIAYYAGLEQDEQGEWVEKQLGNGPADS